MPVFFSPEMLEAIFPEIYFQYAFPWWAPRQPWLLSTLGGETGIISNTLSHIEREVQGCALRGLHFSPESALL